VCAARYDSRYEVRRGAWCSVGTLRIDSDCIGVFLSLAKSTRLPILLCNFFQFGRGAQAYGTISRNPTVRLAKWQTLVQMSISLFFFKSYGKSLQKISEPGFPHNFAKNDRQDLKMGCTDASRRQL
jgi:hypothetical protein